MISAFHILEMDDWKVNYTRCRHLDQGKWTPRPGIFNLVGQEYGGPECGYYDLQIHKFPFVARTKDPLALALDALIIPMIFITLNFHR